MLLVLSAVYYRSILRVKGETVQSVTDFLLVDVCVFICYYKLYTNSIRSEVPTTLRNAITVSLNV